MYPDLPQSKVIFPGNTSLKVTYILIINRDLLSEIGRIKGKIEYLQLNNETDFIGKMRIASFIHHNNLELYPSVKQELIKKGILR